MDLALATKERITPLLEMPEIGWDFETGTEVKTVDEHLAPFARRLKAKWGTRACFVDLGLLGPTDRMANGTHPVAFVFGELRKYGCVGIPVTGVERSAEDVKAVHDAARRDGLGVCLRISIERAAKPGLGTAVGAALRNLDVTPQATDFVLDLGAPNFLPLEGFSKLVESVVRALPHLNQWRTLTIIGTSFPRTMGALAAGGQLVQRYEWLLYKTVMRRLRQEACRLPRFGDYGIAHPDVLRVDMRKVRPAATIRYTVADAWYIIKGRNVRDHGFRQYRKHCLQVSRSAFFAGRTFSVADAYIEDCANGLRKCGNLTTWRRVGTNHHIERVAADIARLFAQSGTT